jgi:hypothetical protein
MMHTPKHYWAARSARPKKGPYARVEQAPAVLALLGTGWTRSFRRSSPPERTRRIRCGPEIWPWRAFYDQGYRVNRGHGA